MSLINACTFSRDETLEMHGKGIDLGQSKGEASVDARVSLRERLWVFTPIVSLTIYTASTNIIQFSIPPSDLPDPENTRAVSLPARSRLRVSTEILGGVRVVPSVCGRNSLNARALYSMELECSPKGTRRSCRQRTGGSVVTKTRTVRM